MRAYQSQNIRIVEIELTNRCNAGCPMCARYAGDGTTTLDPDVSLDEMRLDDFMKVMPEAFVRQLDKVILCGNTGDPIAAQDLLEVVRYLRESKPTLRIAVHTNGNPRSHEWWKQMGYLMAVPGSYVQFAIDGLADTNHLYRRGTSFERIISNAKELISAGGNARWQFIVFKHNEHQVPDARALAAQLGFERFEAKRTSRFQFTDPAYQDGAFIVKGKKGDITHKLEMPVTPEYQAPAYGYIDAVVAKHGSIEGFFDATPIHCRMAAKQRIYIDAHSRVWPCAWTCKQSTTRLGEGIRNILTEVGGVDTLDARSRPIVDIIDGLFFQRVEESWNKDSVATGKLKVCARHCGAVNLLQE